MRFTKSWAAAVTMVFLTGAVQAGLVTRPGGMIYDTSRNITWLADMNYAVTSGYAAANAGGTGSDQILSDGRMGWDAATAWANDLVYGGYDDWRLPTLNAYSDTTCGLTYDRGGGFPLVYYGFNCTGGELSGLFGTDLGNKANESVLDQIGDTPEQIANLALFSNVQSSVYWSGTEDPPDPGAFGYYSASGLQQAPFKVYAWHAVAVRPGDVAASVPEPQTLALALLALGVAVVVRRRPPR
jgi:MYXO-CTERM domain-containing protein